MDNSKILDYISQARSRGMTDDQIKQNLVQAGWPQAQISQFFTPSNPVPPPLVPPAPKLVSGELADYHLNMWIVFQYILMFITLAVSAIALTGIMHYYVNQSLGTAAANTYSVFSDYSSTALLGYIASLIVGFPIFGFLFIYLRQQIEKMPEIRNIKSRKFFIYIALLWTFIVLITRLVGTVYSFLQGTENVLASLAHLVITFAISGSIFMYFILDVKKGYSSK